MLLFTTDVTETFEWFELTHQVKTGTGAPVWQRTSLPAAGGLEDQPARLMEALALVAREENRQIRMAMKSQTNRGPNG